MLFREDAPVRVLPAALAMLSFVAVMFLMIGCDRPASRSKVTAHSSVREVSGKLPNLARYRIESCTYTFSESNSGRGVPSPSDIRVELKGSLRLAENGYEEIKAGFEWGRIDRADVPSVLEAILPEGDLLSSARLNESFSENPTFAHGFVVTQAVDASCRLFFLSTDIDHPME